MSEIVKSENKNWYQLDIEYFGSFVVSAANEEHAWERLHAYGQHVNGVLNLNPDVLPFMKHAHYLNGEGAIYDRYSEITPEDDPKGFTTGIHTLQLHSLLPSLPDVIYGEIKPEQTAKTEQLIFDTDYDRWPSPN